MKKALKNSAFVKSFKFDMEFVYMIFLDLSHYIVLFLIFMLMKEMLMPLISKVQALPAILSGMDTSTSDQILEQIVMVKSAIFKLIAAVFLAFMLFALNWTFFKSLIWSKMRKIAFTLKLYLNSLLLNIILFLLVIIVSYYSLNAMKTAALPWIILFLYVPLLLFLSASIFLSVESSFKKSFFGFFKKLGRIHYFVLPVMIILIMGIILLMLLFTLTQGIDPELFISEYATPNPILLLLDIFVLLAYAAWARRYLLLAAKKRS